MPQEKTPFNHRDHLERLERAATELDTLGKLELSGAIRRAIALHNEFLTRIYSARNIRHQVNRLAGSLQQIVAGMDIYVTKDEAPWILPPNTLLDPDGK